MPTTVDAWVDSLMPDLPSLTVAYARRIVLEQAREYCTRSWAWREELGPYPVSADETELDIGTNDDKDIQYVIRVSTGGIPLTALAFRPAVGSTTSYSHIAGKPAYRRGIEPQYVYWHPAVATDFEEPAYVLVAYSPALDVAKTFTDGLLQHRHFEAIRMGALGRLQDMHDKPWGNPLLGKANLRRFYAAITSTRDIADREYTSADTAWTYPTWA